MTHRIDENTNPFRLNVVHCDSLEIEPTPLKHMEINCIVSAVDRLLEFDDEEIAPTPIGTQGLKIVDKVNLTESPWLGDRNFIACLSPFLKKRKADDGDILKVASVATKMPSYNSADRLDGRKRQRIEVSDDSSLSVASASSVNSLSSSAADSDDSSMLQLRPYQSDQWYEKYRKLVEFKRKNGHCNVSNPLGFGNKNSPLALWVKRQRYQYKLKREGQHSTLTEEREKALEDLGFVWDSHGAVWEERLAELQTFKAICGHCNVPAGSENRQLAIWVKCQRRQYKLFCDGERSNMNQERIAKLESLGFVWNPRKLRTER